MESDDLISVHMSPKYYAGPRIPDATVVRPVRYYDDSFVIASYISNIDCDRKPRAFYTVVAVADNTDVQVRITQFTFNENLPMAC